MGPDGLEPSTPTTRQTGLVDSRGIEPLTFRTRLPKLVTVPGFEPGGLSDVNRTLYHCRPEDGEPLAQAIMDPGRTISHCPSTTIYFLGTTRLLK